MSRQICGKYWQFAKTDPGGEGKTDRPMRSRDIARVACTFWGRVGAPDYMVGLNYIL